MTTPVTTHLHPQGWQRTAVAVVAVLVALDAVTYLSWAGSDGFAVDPVLFGGGLAVGAVLLAAALLFRTRPWAVAAVAATVGITVVAAIPAYAGVPLRGGVGERDWTPSGDVASSYRLLSGDAVLDLTATDALVVDTDVSVVAGSVRVVVPADAWVDVRARSGVGSIEVLGEYDDGAGASRHVTSPGVGRIVRLDVRAGAGDIEVVRTS